MFHDRTLWLFRILACLALATATRPALAAEPDAEGFVPLLVGSDHAGWYKLLAGRARNDDPDGIIRIEDGVVTMYRDASAGTEQPYGSLETEGEFSDYDLRLEYRWGTKMFLPLRAAMKRDAGVLYHCFGPDGLVGPWPRSNEFQIQEGDTGDITGVLIQLTATVDPAAGGDGSDGHPAKFLTPSDGGMLETFGGASQMTNISKRGDFEVPGWNKIELSVRGDAAVYRVNGHVVNRCSGLKQPTDDDPTKFVPLTKGRILIQAEGAEVQYRNIRLRPANAETAAAPR